MQVVVELRHDIIIIREKYEQATFVRLWSSGSKKKSKRGKASSKGVRAAKGPKRGLAAADSASLSGGGSADWTLGTSATKGMIAAFGIAWSLLHWC